MWGLGDPIVAAFVSSVATAAVTATTTLHLGRKARRDDRRTLVRESATELRQALEAVRSVLDGVQQKTILPDQASAHMSAWGRTFERHRHRLPDRAGHLHRSVVSAMGEAIGGAAASYSDHRLVGYPFASYDPEWHEHAYDYITTVMAWMARWQDDPDISDAPRSFDAWLGEVKRRHAWLTEGPMDRLLRGIGRLLRRTPL